MKKTFKFFAAALAIVAAASCSKEINTPTDEIQSEEQKVLMTFSASIDSEGDTKTALNNRLVEWQEGDMITLYGNKAYNTGNGYNKHKGYCTIDATSMLEDKTQADFIGEVALSEEYCALYPGGKVAGTETDLWTCDNSIDYKFVFNGFAHQKAIKSSFDPSKHVMIAPTAENGQSFKFKNVCALAKVTIGAENVYSIKVEGKALYQSYGEMGSIGGNTGWKVNNNGLFEYTYDSFNKIHYIELKDENGAALEKGATYYVVLPACTIKDYSVSICDYSGNVIGSKSKASDFVVERNKIYDMGVLEDLDNLNVDKSSFSFNANSTSDIIKITTNRYWQITSDASWITFDVSSGEACLEKPVTVSVAPNDRGKSRSATITISAGALTKIITVTQEAPTYRVVGSKLTYASELQDGGLYVIRSKAKTYMYWTESNGRLTTSTHTSTNDDFPAATVFEYKSDASKINKSLDDYGSWSAGAWKSLSTGKYLDENFNLSAELSNAVYLVSANNWGNQGGDELEGYDVYDSKSTNNDKHTLWYRHSAFEWGDLNKYQSDGGPSYRKYYVYKVERR